MVNLLSKPNGGAHPEIILVNQLIVDRNRALAPNSRCLLRITFVFEFQLHWHSSTMRGHHIVLLIATSLLASANAAPEFNINSPAFNPSLTAAHQDVSAQRLLRVHYTGEAKNNEERGISTFVEKAKSVLSSSKISEKTLERWVRNKKSPGDALIRLKLHKTGGKLFENPQFNTWVTIVKRTNPHNPEAAMISALMGRYSDDVLSQAIIAAKKVPGTKDLASKLQIEQTVAWLKKGKSSDDVFNFFQLKTAGKQIFDNPQFTVWTKYVDDLSKNDADKAGLTMLSTLGAHYSDDVITEIDTTCQEGPIDGKYCDETGECAAIILAVQEQDPP
ncbi:unnamed protein product [Phytophthora fragariaefolia]|uniref:RxLR effector protein n=1 Tax=Phytophthora fragariaefolia TaxID=1490495 RepID=A0A9W7D0P8_9STRA|nr:unnamed protein product [Phytophthora fragariaefolia]